MKTYRIIKTGDLITVETDQSGAPVVIRKNGVNIREIEVGGPADLTESVKALDTMIRLGIAEILGEEVRT